MPSADFYLIAKPRFAQDPLLLVCELARKAYAQRTPTLVLARSMEDAEAIDARLWEFDEDAYIPHQICGEEDDAVTPVLICPPGSELPTRPLVINLREECVEPPFERVLEVVAADPAEREGSRRRWREYQQRGITLAKHDM